MGRVKEVKAGKGGKVADPAAAEFSAKGIVNLGNTCFFNSVMQNLVRTTGFRERVLGACAGGEEGAEGDEDQAGEVGPLLQELGRFFKGLSGVYTLKSANVKPSSLFAELIRQSPRYKGFQQHDAHELLLTVLDNVRMEECKRITAEEEAAAEAAGGGADENADEKAEPAKKVRKPPPRTLIDDVFGGKQSNAITCLVCGTESVIWEPSLGLSIQIPERYHQQLRSETAAKKVRPQPRTPRGLWCREKRRFGAGDNSLV